jgi:hypothetical protein
MSTRWKTEGAYDKSKEKHVERFTGRWTLHIPCEATERQNPFPSAISFDNCSALSQRAGRAQPDFLQDKQGTSLRAGPHSKMATLRCIKPSPSLFVSSPTFGVYSARMTYHATGGLYLQINRDERKGRNFLKNHSV